MANSQWEINSKFMFATHGTRCAAFSPNRFIRGRVARALEAAVSAADEQARVFCSRSRKPALQPTRNLHFKQKTSLKMFIACTAKPSWHTALDWWRCGFVLLVAWLARRTICAQRFVCYWVEFDMCGNDPQTFISTRRKRANNDEWRGAARKKVINRSHNSCSDSALPEKHSSSFLVRLNQRQASTCVKVWYSVKEHMFDDSTLRRFIYYFLRRRLCLELQRRCKRLQVACLVIKTTSWRLSRRWSLQTPPSTMPKQGEKRNQ